MSKRNETISFPVKSLYNILLEHVSSMDETCEKCSIVSIQEDLENSTLLKECEGKCGKRRTNLQPYLFYCYLTGGFMTSHCEAVNIHLTKVKN